jgi:hypothetical protein
VVHICWKPGRRIQMKLSSLVASVVTVAVATVGLASPAGAASSTDGEAIASAVARVSQSSWTSGTSGAPQKLKDGIMVGAAGQQIRIHTGSADAADASIVAGRAVFARSERSTSTVVQQSGLDTQIIKVIEGPSAPTAYTFRFDLAADMRLAKTSAGGVVIERGDEVIGYVEAPWAVDASGARIATSYEIRDNLLVQTVAHAGSAYPVVADPSVSAGRYWYVRYSKSEVARQNVRLIEAGNTAMIALACGMLAAVNAILGVVCGAALGAVASSVAGQVRDAARARQCILHRYTLTPIILVAWERYNC